MTESVGLQHLVTVPDRAVYRAMVAQRRRGRDGEIRVAVGDCRIVVAEDIILQVRITMSGGYRTRTRLVQSQGDSVKDLGQS